MQYENEGDAVSERTRSQQLQLWLRDVLGIEKDKRVDEWMTITSSSAALASGFLADRVVWVDGEMGSNELWGFCFEPRRKAWEMFKPTATYARMGSHS